jgi:hypothetical protein
VQAFGALRLDMRFIPQLPPGGSTSAPDFLCAVQLNSLVRSISGLVYLLTTAGVALGLVIGYVLAWKRLATLAAQPMKVWLTGCGVFASLLIFPWAGCRCSSGRSGF